MTRVRYEPGRFCLTVAGHAGAGPRGQDLVCAALSMLTATLEAAAEAQAERLRPTVRRSPGRVQIRCRPEPDSRGLCRCVFETVFAGFTLLGGQYPDKVSITIE